MQGNPSYQPWGCLSSPSHAGVQIPQLTQIFHMNTLIVHMCCDMERFRKHYSWGPPRVRAWLDFVGQLSSRLFGSKSFKEYFQSSLEHELSAYKTIHSASNLDDLKSARPLCPTSTNSRVKQRSWLPPWSMTCSPFYECPISSDSLCSVCVCSIVSSSLRSHGL